ncbi:hypothetical protein HXW90_06585 [Pseudomonas sp. Y39-6]|uniref:hypothetical protein n=1 Tax=unclassified Pseudomonas TaxID=196821 RepID=UPI0019106E4F|nr:MULTISPECIES: hypothetical protein [unclassified Pseudomonas]QPO19208.1 hypothetical protein HXW90_06585 [Pseudomonas sp. Y39-6]URS62327.1 hypothetical protein JN756_06590 [Pseudomonas sp. Y39-6]
MSTETQIANLVQASNNLTSAVNGKIGAIDVRMDQARAEFDQFRALKDVVGGVGEPGTLLMSVFQGLIWGTGAPYDVGATGGMDATDLGSSMNVYVHFKLPFSINSDDQMFWLNIRGYSYGSSLVLDETFAGYVYSPQRAVINQSCFGKFEPAIYADAAGNAVCRIKIPNVYVTSLRLDTMQVGRYRAIKLGDIKSKLSLSSTVVF